MNIPEILAVAEELEQEARDYTPDPKLWLELREWSARLRAAVPPTDKAEGVKERAALRQQVFVLIDEFWQAVAHAYCERGHMSEKGIAARKALRQAIIDLSGFEGQA